MGGSVEVFGGDGGGGGGWGDPHPVGLGRDMGVGMRRGGGSAVGVLCRYYL